MTNEEIIAQLQQQINGLSSPSEPAPKITMSEAVRYLEDMAINGIFNLNEYNAVKIAINSLKSDLDMSKRIETIISQLEQAQHDTVETLCYLAYEDALNIIRKNLKED